MDKAKLITFAILGIIIIAGTIVILKLNKKQKELETKLTTANTIK